MAAKVQRYVENVFLCNDANSSSTSRFGSGKATTSDIGSAGPLAMLSCFGMGATLASRMGKLSWGSTFFCATAPRSCS
jgi:hypothetical protein